MDVVIGIAMTSRDARILLVARDECRTVGHDARIRADHPRYGERIAAEVLGVCAAASAAGNTVARIVFNWTHGASVEATILVEALMEQGLGEVLVVPTCDPLDAVVDAESGSEMLVAEMRSALSRPAVASGDLVRSHATPAVPLVRTVAMLVVTVLLVVGGSMFVAVTAHRGDDGHPVQASTEIVHR